ncbi:MAG: HupE/UreJ family protein [Pseudomonadota bacterium]
MIRLFAACAFLVTILAGHNAIGHELRPGYLEITETSPENYDLQFKVPTNGQVRLPLFVALPEDCTETSPIVSSRIDNADISRWKSVCVDGLAGKEITIDGLSATYTDALIRIVNLDGTVQTSRITPDDPVVLVVASPSAAETAYTYFVLGVDHIIFGFDHLLFVFALLLLIGDLRSLFFTITAFTVAHSITLALAALGWSSVPQPPVEALIALSICFVAAEIVRKERGIIDFTASHPWSVAFLFGLLHGLGFGGALRDIGLPQKDIPLALLTFNLGVEVGQLLFVAVVVAIGLGIRRLFNADLTWKRSVLAYGIGIVSATWFVQRIFSF